MHFVDVSCGFAFGFFLNFWLNSGNMLVSIFNVLTICKAFKLCQAVVLLLVMTFLDKLSLGATILLGIMLLLV